MTHFLPLYPTKPIVGFITAKETYMQIMFLHWGKRTVKISQPCLPMRWQEWVGADGLWMSMEEEDTMQMHNEKKPSKKMITRVCSSAMVDELMASLGLKVSTIHQPSDGKMCRLLVYLLHSPVNKEQQSFVQLSD